MNELIPLKDAKPFKLYRYAKPLPEEIGILVMPVGEKYSKDSSYFIEIHQDHIEVQTYSDIMQLIEVGKKASDIDFRPLYFEAVFSNRINSESHGNTFFVAHSNAAADFLTRARLI